MKKWTTLLIGVTLLLAATAACGGQPTTDPTATPAVTPTSTVVASSDVPTDWHLVGVPIGQPRFSLWLPPGWQLNELQGIDSLVGEIVGDDMLLGFDFGWYSNPLADEDYPLHIVTYEDIGGRRAKLVQPSEGMAGSVGVYFEDFDNLGEASFAVDRLTIVGRGLSKEQQETAFTVFRSIRDNDADQTHDTVADHVDGSEDDGSQAQMEAYLAAMIDLNDALANVGNPDAGGAMGDALAAAQEVATFTPFFERLSPRGMALLAAFYGGRMQEVNAEAADHITRIVNTMTGTEELAAVLQLGPAFALTDTSTSPLREVEEGEEQGSGSVDLGMPIMPGEETGEGTPIPILVLPDGTPVPEPSESTPIVTGELSQ